MEKVMDKMEVAAHFLAFTAFLNRDDGHPVSPGEAGRFARKNWIAFLPYPTEALAEASDFHPDVVLCDLAMPGLNGCNVAESLRRDSAHDETLLVALTAHGDEDSRRRAARAGFQAHFVKPIEADDLHRLLEYQ